MGLGLIVRDRTKEGNRQSMDGAINKIESRKKLRIERKEICCGFTHALPLPWLCLFPSPFLLSPINSFSFLFVNIY